MKEINIDLEYKGYHRFSMTLRARVTILTGDSATGKSTIARLNVDYVLLSADTTTRVFNYDPDVPIENQLSTVRDAKALLLDEDSVVGLLNAGHLLEIMHMDKALLLITRDIPQEVQCSYTDIYTLETIGSVTTAVRMYPDFTTLPKASMYTCEDSSTGHRYFSNYLNISAPMCGNYNWKTALGDCLIMDGACVGQFIENMMKSGKKLFLPESFEFLLLQYYCGYTHEQAVADLKDDITFERLYDRLTVQEKRLGFTYSKSFTTGRFYYARLLPELNGLPNKDLSAKVSVDITDSAIVRKESCKGRLSEFLCSIGLSECFLQVYDKLPGSMHEYELPTEIVFALHDLGVKEFQ